MTILEAFSFIQSSAFQVLSCEHQYTVLFALLSNATMIILDVSVLYQAHIFYDASEANVLTVPAECSAAVA